jgi:tRNA nucleotidyltransferase (CCA-adding enzyme)
MPDKTDLECYLVGGAVRDGLMDREPNDRDYVVVGETPESMKDRGFQQVGKGFPVFLDDNGDEYALARTEDTTGDGYNDFECEWDGVGLVDDLERRDFTINSMAVPKTKEHDFTVDDVIDPFGGRDDLMNTTLRNVSEAFVEDPLRALRACRFATRFQFYFQMTDELKAMCQNLAPKITELPGERIGEEIIKGIKQTEYMETYFGMMNQLDILKHIAPELYVLKFVPAGYSHNHMEGSTWEHTLMVLREIQSIAGNDVKATLGALCHDVGKYVTHYANEKNNHGGHDTKGIPLIRKLASRWKFSNDHEQAMVNGARFHLRLQNLPDMRSGKTIKFVQKLDKYNIERLLDIVEADRYGRQPKGCFDERQLIKDHINCAKRAIESYTGEDLKESGYEGSGEAFGQTLLNRRAQRYKRMVDK